MCILKESQSDSEHHVGSIMMGKTTDDHASVCLGEGLDIKNNNHCSIEIKKHSAEHDDGDDDGDNRDEKHNPIDWPGEYGKPVVLTGVLKAESEKRFEENQFNVVASDLIALNRTLPDNRLAK